LIPTPSFTEHFSTLAGSYDVVLSDVWGVIHNGVAATKAACDALTRFAPRAAR
jgi:ribonucleotide monophosphatase NagD (HAD superfamily)